MIHEIDTARQGTEKNVVLSLSLPSVVELTDSFATEEVFVDRIGVIGGDTGMCDAGFSQTQVVQEIDTARRGRAKNVVSSFWLPSVVEIDTPKSSSLDRIRVGG